MKDKKRGIGKGIEHQGIKGRHLPEPAALTFSAAAVVR